MTGRTSAAKPEPFLGDVLERFRTGRFRGLLMAVAAASCAGEPRSPGPPPPSRFAGDPRAVLTDAASSVAVRMQAVELIDPRAASGQAALTRILDTPEAPPQLRVVAARRLSGGCRSAASVLRRHVDDPDLARTAVESLLRLDEAEVLADVLLHASREASEEAVRALAGREGGLEETIPALAALLQDPSRRSEAARALSQRGPRAVGSLVTALESTDPSLRGSATYALGTMREAAKAAVPALRRLATSDPDRTVRQSSTTALRQVGPTLEELAGEPQQAPDEDARRRAVSRMNVAVHRLGPHAGALVAPLRRLLADPSPDVRATAASALGDIGEPALVAIPEVLELLALDPRSHVRRVAALALLRFHRTAASKEVRARIVAGLQAQSGDADHEVRQAVEQTLRGVASGRQRKAPWCEVAR